MGLHHQVSDMEYTVEELGSLMEIEPFRKALRCDKVMEDAVPLYRSAAIVDFGTVEYPVFIKSKSVFCFRSFFSFSPSLFI